MNNNQFDLRNCNSPEDLIKCLGSIKTNNQRKDHLKCVIYIRKSRIISGKEHYSDRAQEENCRAYAEQKGLELLSVFIDLDLSGKNSKRCAFQQMLDHRLAGERRAVRTGRGAAAALDLDHPAAGAVGA